MFLRHLRALAGGSAEPAEPPVPAPSARAPRGASELDQAALDALCGVLRSFGDNAIELPDTNLLDIARTFERWSMHLSMAAPHPLTPRDADGEASTYAGPTRDFAGLVQYFRGHRRRESTHVVRALAELRGLIWSCVERMARSLPDESRFESSTRGQLERLRSAVSGASLAELRQEALSTASVIERALEARNERRQAEVQVLLERINALRAELEDARQESETDALTGLANRRAFDAQVERAVVMSLLCRESNALLLIDLDHFKQVNDTYGHPAGDEVLREVSACLVRNFPRRMDCVARIGGEELAVLLRESTESDAIRLAQRFLQQLRLLAIDAGGRTIRVTASIGVAALSEGEEAPGWITRADRALYRAKSEGRDRVVGHSPAFVA